MTEHPAVVWYNDQYNRGLGIGSHPEYMPVQKKRALSEVLRGFQKQDRYFRKLSFDKQIKKLWDMDILPDAVNAELAKDKLGKIIQQHRRCGAF